MESRLKQWAPAAWILACPAAVTAQAGDASRPADTSVSVATTAPVAPVRPVRATTDLLVGAFPGVVVFPASGLTGSGNRVRIRGHGSLYLGNRPAVYLDGVRIEGMVHDETFLNRGPSPLDDINPDDVDSIAIVRGPAAGGIYGPEAASGAILLYTQRGQVGPPRWHVYAEEGWQWDPTEWPANYGGVDADNPSIHYQNGGCTLAAEAEGRCTQDFVRRFSPLEARSQFRTAPRRRAGASVAGGAGRVRYAGGADVEREAGIYELSRAETERLVAQGFDIRDHVHEPSGLGRLRARGSLAIQLTPAIALDAWGGVGNHSLRPGPDLGLLGSGLRGSSDSTINDGWAVSPGALFQTERRQDVHYHTIGLRVTGRVNRFFTVDALGGWHAHDGAELHLTRTGEGTQGQVPPGTSRFGSRAVRDTRVSHRTLSLTAAAAYRLAGLDARSAVTVRHTKRLVVDSSFVQNWSVNTARVPDSLTVSAGGWRRRESPLFALFVAQDLAWRNEVAVTLGIRADKRDVPRVTVPFEEPFGGGSEWILHPSVGIEWSALRRPAAALDRLVVHAAYGTADQRIHRSFVAPERTVEAEVGARTELWSGRATLGATFYQRRLSNGISFGYASGPFHLPRNDVRVHNTGVELSAEATPLRRGRLAWDLALTAWGNRNRTRDLPPLFVGFGFPSMQAMFEGYPLAAYWGHGYTYRDANANGVIERAEVTQDAVARYLGNPFPSHGASLRTSVGVVGRVRLAALFEYRAGHQLFNHTAWGRCLALACAELFDRHTPLERQAAAVAGTVPGTGPSSLLGSGFIEDADFVKLRELALSVELPSRVAARIGARGASVMLAGRNLVTWTGYSGADPEAIASLRPEELALAPFQTPAPVGFAMEDYMVQPAPRIWTLRLDVRF